MSGREQRVLVVGLDGGTLDVLKPLAEEGLLPHIARLMREGAWGALRSTTPPHSAPAWASFATGANPGRHGVFHFRAIDRSFYEGRDYIRIVDARSIALPTLWERVSRAGKRVGVLNVPLTYPAQPVNGFLVSGMPAPPAPTAFTYPPELAASLPDYQIDVAATDDGTFLAEHDLRSPEGLAWLAGNLERQLEQRVGVSLRLLAEHRPDLAVVVFTETDRLQHFFWPCLSQREGVPAELRPYTRWAHDFLARVDRAIGELREALGEDTVSVVMSDHGFGPYPSRVFFPNVWLRERGWLRQGAGSLRALPLALLSSVGLTRERLQRLATKLGRSDRAGQLQATLGRRVRQPIDWGRTQVYFMPLFDFVGGMVARQPAGATGRAEEALLEAVTGALQETVDSASNVPVVEWVLRREQVYHGPYTERAPDLIFVLSPAYKNDRSLLSRAPFADVSPLAQPWRGTHRYEGMLLMAGAALRPGAQIERACIEDLAPTILYLLGLPVPEVMDGHVLTQAFVPDYVDARPVYTCTDTSPEPGTPLDVGQGEAEDQARIAERLRALGYLD